MTNWHELTFVRSNESISPPKDTDIYLKGTTEINFLPNYIICPLTRISRRRRCESRVIVCSKRTPNGWKTDRNKSSLSQYIATRQQSKVWHPPIYTTDKLYSFRSPYFARWHFNRSCKRRRRRRRRSRRPSTTSARLSTLSIGWA